MPGDSNYGNVSLLLHGNGSNNGTTFTDSGPNALTVTRNGSPVTSTTQVKYGSAALYFPQSTNDYLSLPVGSAFNFGTGAFTIEWWHYAGTQPGTINSCIGTASLPTDGGWKVYHRSSSANRFRFQYRDSGGNFVDIQSTTTNPNDSTWHHMAIVRNGTTITLYFDGTSVASATYAGNIGSSSVALNVGGISGDSQYLTGYMDDVRITKGVARYTANFTPPAAELPDTYPDTEVRVSVEGPLGTPAVLGGQSRAFVSVDGPLGSPAVFGVQQMVNVAVHGPLGAPAVFGAQQLVTVSVPGPLGTPAALVGQSLVNVSVPSPLGAFQSLLFVRPAAQISVPSPLGAPSAIAWHDFTGAVSETSTLAYVMDLIVSGSPVRVPISSWQATLQTGASCYVQCVIPACLDWVESIAAATEFVIWRRATLTDGSAIEYEMARSPADTRSYAQGPNNYTCTLSGYPDALTSDSSPPTAYDRTLSGVRSVFDGDGGIRVTADIDWLLRPGMRAYYGETEILVDYINYYVPGSDQYMLVGERA